MSYNIGQGLCQLVMRHFVLMLSFVKHQIFFVFQGEGNFVAFFQECLTLRSTTWCHIRNVNLKWQCFHFEGNFFWKLVANIWSQVHTCLPWPSSTLQQEPSRNAYKMRSDKQIKRNKNRDYRYYFPRVGHDSHQDFDISLSSFTTWKKMIRKSEIKKI